ATKPQPFIATAKSGHEVRLSLPRLHRRASVYPDRQAARVAESLVNFVVRPERYVLYRRYPDPSRFLQSHFERLVILGGGWLRDDFVDQADSCVLEHSSGFTGFWVSDDSTPWRVGRFLCYARQPQGYTVGQHHMAVQAFHRHGIISSIRVDQFARRQRRARPELMIPVAAGYPAPRPDFLRLASNPLSEFLLRPGIAQVDRQQLESPRHEVRVVVDEARHGKPAFQVDQARVRPGQLHDLFIRSDSDYSFAPRGQSLNPGRCFVAGPDAASRQDKTGANIAL